MSAAVVGSTDAKTLQGFVGDHGLLRALPSTRMTTRAIRSMPFDHKTVKHSVSEYVNGMAPH